jgi:hypothetical protein
VQGPGSRPLGQLLHTKKIVHTTETIARPRKQQRNTWQALAGYLGLGPENNASMLCLRLSGRQHSMAICVALVYQHGAGFGCPQRASSAPQRASAYALAVDAAVSQFAYRSSQFARVEQQEVWPRFQVVHRPVRREHEW